MCKLFVFLTCILAATIGYSQDEPNLNDTNVEDVSDLPTEVGSEIETQANQLGMDLDSQEGRKEFRKHIRKKRKRHAKGLGFDLDSPRGKKQYREHLEKEFAKAAKKDGLKLKRPEHRRKLVKKMIREGKLEMVPMQRGAYEKHGWRPPPLADLHHLPKEVREEMGKKADALGMDLNTSKGRENFEDHLKKQEGKQAKSLGLDVKRPEGKEAFRQKKEQHLRKIAKQEKVDLKTPEGRRHVTNVLIERGEIGFLPFDRESIQRPSLQRAGFNQQGPPLDVRQLPKEVRGPLAEQAANLGIDISTREGQRELGNFVERRRQKEARKLGVSLESRNGREKFERHVDKEMKKIARKDKLDMKNENGREKVLNKMMARGAIGLVPSDRRGFERRNWHAPGMKKDRKQGYSRDNRNKDRASKRPNHRPNRKPASVRSRGGQPNQGGNKSSQPQGNAPRRHHR